MAIGQLMTLMVTGGGGIGLEIARICAGEGMNVVLADIDRDRLDGTVAAFAEPVLGIVMDVAAVADWTRAKAEAEARFGAVDLLVNGAAVPPSMVPILDLAIADFDARIATNLSSVFYGVRTFGPGMRDRGFGHIVNIASEAGLSPMPTLGDYGTAKYGVVGLTEILRLELAEAGIGVTVVTPGLTRSNMTVGRGMDPAFVGKAIVDGIRANAAYVITHPASARAGIERRHNALLAAIGEPAEPGYGPTSARSE